MKNYEREDVLHFLLKSLVKQIDINDDNCFLLEVKDKYGNTRQDNIAWSLENLSKEKLPDQQKWENETSGFGSMFDDEEYFEQGYYDLQTIGNNLYKFTLCKPIMKE